METKICSKCNTEKTLEQFRKCGNRLRSECRECELEYAKKRQKEHGKEIYEREKEKKKIYREQHKEKYKNYMKNYYLEHKNDEHYIQKRKEYSEKYVRPQESIERHKQKNKEWQKKNKQHILEYQREYRKRHKEQIFKKDKEWKMNNLEKVKEYQQRDYKKRANDPILRLERNIRNNVNTAFRKKGFKKSERLKNMLGMEINDFVLYLLETFKDNYGYEWDKKEPVHIDHIIPLSTANTEEEVIKLFHYSNLQLLKAKDNLSKNDSLNWKLKIRNENKFDMTHNA